jgi:uracil-DNA glycosylase family 4
MLVMSDRYQQLLEATIRHLENRKAQGVNFIPVSQETLTALVSSCVGESNAAATAPNRSPARTPQATPMFDAILGPPPPANAASAAPALPGAAPLDLQTKQAAMAELQARAMVCRKCPHLAASRKNVVFGVGDVDSPLMFVGEAPGADEDEQGEPFVGKAGQLLTRIIQAMGFTRHTVYIANILKCRPDTPGQSVGKPTLDEMKTCLPYLLAQIDLIQPEVIVALGATAVEGMLGKTAGITKLRGQWQEFRAVPVMPTYHPAYLLRNQALGEKRKVWEDMLHVLERLGRPISEKQRNYFMNA